MKILYVASEALPFASTGGLADVMGSLPAAVKRASGGTADVRVVIPMYRRIKERAVRNAEFRLVSEGTVSLAWRQQYCGIWETERDGVWIINTPGATYHSYGNDLVRGSRLITINEKDTSTFTSRIVTVNDAAIADETFAADVGINPTFAKIQMFFGEVAKVLGRAASPIFKVLGYLSKFA